MPGSRATAPVAGRARVFGVVVAATLAVAAGLAGSSCGSDPEPSSDGPFAHDLIVVSVDTLRADRLGLYGADRATDLDPAAAWSPRWLGEQGTVFESCWAPAGKTVPSLATLWTGREPLEHGAVTHMTVMQGPTYAERLAARGYRSFARCANASVVEEYGIHRGFESYARRPKQQEPRVGLDLLQLAGPVVEAGEPLLLWAHFMAPHQPYAPPAEDDLWAGPDGPPGSNEVLKGYHLDPASADAAAIDRMRDLYDGEVRYSSRLVQSFLAGLDQRYRDAGRGGLLDNAVVVFTSDHGEELGDRHGYFLHAKSLSSGVIQVPLVIAGPGWERGRRDSDLFALADVLPLALGDAPAPRETVVATWQREFWSVRDPRWTLIHHPCEHLPDGPHEPPYPHQGGRYPYPELALYDRSADPDEQRDLAAEHPQEVRRLLGALNAWLDGLELAEVQAFRRTKDNASFLDKLVHPEWFAPDGCRPLAE